MATMDQQTRTGIRARLSQARSANWDEDPTARSLGRRIASAYDVTAWCYLQIPGPCLDRAGTRVARLQAMQNHASDAPGTQNSILVPTPGDTHWNQNQRDVHALSILNDQIRAELGDDPASHCSFSATELLAGRALGKAPTY